MEEEEGSEGDGMAHPFRIRHSDEGIEIEPRREMLLGDVLALQEEEHGGMPRVGGGALFNWQPWNRRAEGGEGGEEDEEGGGGGGEEDEDLEDERSDLTETSSSEDVPRKGPKDTPASPKSPRGGYELVARWNQKLRDIAAQKEALEPNKAEARHGAKKKRIEMSPELPSLEELDAKVRCAELVNKEHATRTKLREISRIREQLRGAPLESLKIRATTSKRVAAYEAAYLTNPDCMVTELRVRMHRDSKEVAISNLMFDAIARAPRLTSLTLSCLSMCMLPAFSAAMLALGPRLKFFAVEDLSELPVRSGLIAALQHLTQLERLELDFGVMPQFAQEEADALGAVMCEKMLKLRSVTLNIESSDQLSDPSTIAGILSCHIQKVSLSGEFFCKRFFAAAKRETSMLQRLRVDGNRARHCFPVLLLPHLKDLFLTDCLFSLKHCQRLGQFLSHPDCHLERLSLSVGTRINDDGFIAHALLRNSQLKSLSIRETRQSRLLILAALAATSSLQEVKISMRGRTLLPLEDLQLKGALARSVLTSLCLVSVHLSLTELSAGLALCNSLVKLKLSAVDCIPDHDLLSDEEEGQAELAKLLLPFKKIKRIRFSGVTVYRWTMALLLRGNTMLEELSFVYDFDDVEPSYIVAMQDCLNLKVLRLETSWIGHPEEVLRLSETVKLLPLTDLDLAGVEFELDDVEEGEDAGAVGAARAVLASLVLLPRLKSLSLMTAEAMTMAVLLANNPSLEELHVDCFRSPGRLIDMGALLWRSNTHLLRCYALEDDREAMSALTQRNRGMVRRCKQAVITLLAIRKFCKLDAGWMFLPVEVVREMAQYLWSTRAEWCWNTTPLEPNPYV